MQIFPTLLHLSWLSVGWKCRELPKSLFLYTFSTLSLHFTYTLPALLAGLPTLLVHFKRFFESINSSFLLFFCYFSTLNNISSISIFIFIIHRLYIQRLRLYKRNTSFIYSMYFEYKRNAVNQWFMMCVLVFVIWRKTFSVEKFFSTLFSTLRKWLILCLLSLKV